MHKVLVVEDEDMIRKGIVHAVDWGSMGCVVVGEADNGLVGVEKIHELLPDIVVADVTMPLMDGLAMLEETIEKYPYAAIIISGYNEFELAQTAIRIGVSEYLLKPIEFDNLQLAVERAKQQVEQRKIYQRAKQKGEEIGELDLLAGANIDGIASKRVKAMLEYTHAHYAEKMSINDLAERFNISASYLNQKFKSETSYTFNEYLNRYRIMQAIKKIQQGNGKIYTIAEEVGFKDYKYFISVFKKYVNTSPGKFSERKHSGLFLCGE